jgi:sugar phosphate isomerase/epimerase
MLHDRSSIPLACAEFSFLSLEHEVVLDVIAGLGFEGVDISLMSGYAHLPVQEVLDRPEVWGARIRSLVMSRGMEVADVNFLPGGDFEKLAANHPAAGERARGAELFRQALRFTTAAGSAHMTMLPGVFWPHETADESFRRSAAELAWRVSEAAAAGVTLSVEPHVGSVVPTPDAAARLIHATPGLTFTLDFTHFISQGHTQDECMSLTAHASHLHARGGAQGKLQAAAEDNIIDYVRILRALKNQRYSGYFEVEFEWNEWGGCNRVDVLSETILMRDLALTHR